MSYRLNGRRGGASRYLCCAIQSVAKGRAEVTDEGLLKAAEGVSPPSPEPKAATERCCLVTEIFVRRGKMDGN